ncbi:maleylacetate reductase [Kibdelosporangium aridum]|uniref:Maleylacetate reductase n=1 Tax=Kibdelosporangium aridum TaxID=2030 RepID=A0A428ZU96_KIBAR|nr:iron-containing alcohol dehydrogenase [Kibdelosporangium aridum]RSM91615.1 maleylacetate reductase [Kibdelosporangium aridum]
MSDSETRPPAGKFTTAPVDSVHFGPGSIGALAEECERLGVTRLLVVASPSLMTRFDVESCLQRATGGRVVAIFDGSRPHVPHDAVLAGIQTASNAGVDGLLSIGGGSAIDLTKAIAMGITRSVTTRDDLLACRPYTANATSSLPHISVSTTLSAGEFTGFIGITDTVRQVKDIYGAQNFAPQAVILDPEITVHTPRPMWVATGFKAIDHAIEALCSADAQPVVDALATDSLRRLVSYLPSSYQDAWNLHAAGQCQVGAWESIFGVPNVRFGLSHALGHRLGGRLGIPHGITSCVVLPSVLEFNLEYTRAPQQVIAGILATGTGADPRLGAAELLRRFITAQNLPTRLRDLDIRQDDLPALARECVADVLGAANPRPVTSEAEVIEVLRRAW